MDRPSLQRARAAHRAPRPCTAPACPCHHLACMHAWAVAAAGMHGSTSDLLACSWFKRSLSLVPSLLRHAHHAFRAGINRAVTLRLLPLALGSKEGTKGTGGRRPSVRAGRNALHGRRSVVPPVQRRAPPSYHRERSSCCVPLCR